jgi:hypothetical protein
MPRRFPIAQFPNPPLILALAAGAIARTWHGDTGRAMLVVSDLALLVWAYQEVTDGSNWFRRLLGFGGIAYVFGTRTRIVQ